MRCISKININHFLKKSSKNEMWFIYVWTYSVKEILIAKMCPKAFSWIYYEATNKWRIHRQSLLNLFKKEFPKSHMFESSGGAIILHLNSSSGTDVQLSSEYNFRYVIIAVTTCISQFYNQFILGKSMLSADIHIFPIKPTSSLLSLLFIGNPYLKSLSY